MAPKPKQIVASSSAVVAATMMDGTPPQKVLSSGREWLSPLLNTKRHSLNFLLMLSPLLHITRHRLFEVFGIVEHEETLSLNFFLEFLKLPLKLHSR